MKEDNAVKLQNKKRTQNRVIIQLLKSHTPRLFELVVNTNSPVILNYKKQPRRPAVLTVG